MNNQTNDSAILGDSISAVPQKSDSAKPQAGDTTKEMNDWISQFSDTRLITAAIFAFLPSFGVLGVHNFLLKQYKRGAIHAIIAIICGASFIIFDTVCSFGSSCYNLLPLITALRYLIVVSYLWALAEGAHILHLRNQDAVLSQSSNDQDTVQLSQTASSQGVIQSSKPVMNTADIYHSDKPSLETTAKTRQGKKQDSKVWSFLSFATTMVPMVLCVFSLVSSGGSFSENGSGAVWWVVIGYYMTLGIPIEIVSIITGVEGLKTSYRSLAVLSFRLKVIMAAVMFIAMFFQST